MSEIFRDPWTYIALALGGLVGWLLISFVSGEVALVAMMCVCPATGRRDG